MASAIITDIKNQLNLHLNSCEKEVNQINTGKSSVSIISRLFVECYNTKMPLKDLANISEPMPRTVVVYPWDQSILGIVKKAITDANLGFSPIIEKDRILVPIPVLSQERRQELVSVVKEISETTKINIRRLRHEGLHRIDKEEKPVKGEDVAELLKNELQKAIDQTIKQLEKVINHQIELIKS